MDKPRIGKTYIFVRLKNGRLEHTEFCRHADGSAGFVADRNYHVHENHPDAWRGALAELARLGFIEMQEAKASGIVPTDWEPSEESSTLSACRGPLDVSSP
jgi:hypothetical protein